MMHQNDIAFSENRLQAVGLAEVYTRICGNLINIYSHSRNTSKQRILLDMLLAISPNNMEYSIRHAQVCLSLCACECMQRSSVAFTALLQARASLLTWLESDSISRQAHAGQCCYACVTVDKQSLVFGRGILRPVSCAYTSKSDACKCCSSLLWPDIDGCTAERTVLAKLLH